MREHLSASREQVLERLAEIAAELSGLHREIGMVEGQRHQARLEGFRGSREPTVAGRERDAEGNAETYTVALYELRGGAEALAEEQRFLMLLVNHA